MNRVHAQVVVIGAGPAGMAAALRATRCGAQVLIVDQNIGTGGQIWRGVSGGFWQRSFRRARIPRLLGVQIVCADPAEHSLIGENSQTAVEIRYQKLILATGARELFLPFPGWTLPGVMGVGGLQAMARAGMPVRGKRVVLAGSGPLLLAVAAHLRQAGARVLLVAEQAPSSSINILLRQLALRPRKLLQGAMLRGILTGVPYKFSCWVEHAAGRARLESVVLRQGSSTWVEACDFAGVGYGLQPNTEIAQLLGCDVHVGRGIVAGGEQQTSISDVYAAGECTGVGGVDLSLAEGQIAGLAACGELHRNRYLLRVRARARQFARSLEHAFALRPELRHLVQPDTIVCRCEDVRVSELASMFSMRAAKLHSRCGMGPCQGRVCAPAIQFLFGWKPDTVRPPIQPARLETLITESLEPTAKRWDYGWQ